jgi:hypothetical protein
VRVVLPALAAPVHVASGVLNCTRLSIFKNSGVCACSGATAQQVKITAQKIGKANRNILKIYLYGIHRKNTAQCAPINDIVYFC